MMEAVRMWDSTLSYVVLEFYAWNSKWEYFMWNPELVNPAKIKNKKIKEDVEDRTDEG